MHFEILVEDASGKTALEILVPRIIGAEHTFNIHHYKGIGHIPPGLKPKTDSQKRILLDQLPRLIQGYGRTFSAYGHDYSTVLVVVCDLDDRCLSAFRKELLALVDTCDPHPNTCFCIAIEEGEAWFLGDLTAIKTAYPRAKEKILQTYSNDSICGTWEKLADAVFQGGAQRLSELGWQAVGQEKAIWANQISNQMDVDNNLSPSFCYFRDKLRSLSGQ